MSPAGPKRGFPSGGPLWDAHATWWETTYTDGADPEYAGEIVPLVLAELSGARRILDLGCGEGQLSRALLSAPGQERELVGIDPSKGQLDNGVAKGGAVRYLQAAGEELPFADASFDGILCCLAIEHADEPERVLEEAARLLAPGGRFLLLVNHPMYQGPDSGFIDDQVLSERYWRVGAYLAEVVSVEEVDAGVKIPFAHRPLSRYLNPLAAHDVLLTAMYEPPPLKEFLSGSIDPVLEAAIPRLLAMRFELRPPARPAPRRRARAKA